MKVVVFGATGMIGQSVVRECLLDAGVDGVLTVGRSATGQKHEKLREIVHRDLFDPSPLAAELGGLDACFFCLGVSSAGMSEMDYVRVTYDMTLAVARVLLERSSAMTFVYVSGAGTDSSGRGRSMWARVKGRTENALLELPFAAKYMFRPGYIQPLHGIESRTRLYRAAYAISGPLYPVLRKAFPKHMMTTEDIGRAMIEAARSGAPRAVLETADIIALAERSRKTSA